MALNPIRPTNDQSLKTGGEFQPGAFINLASSVYTGLYQVSRALSFQNVTYLELLLRGVYIGSDIGGIGGLKLGWALIWRSDGDPIFWREFSSWEKHEGESRDFWHHGM